MQTIESIPSPESFIFTNDYLCKWEHCQKNFDDAELLYEHLIHEHVGRKANHNLCLECHWDNCKVPAFAKRDHITSHLRVHVPSKPYHCETCRKGFKRPQDLKKHEKTHQEDAAAAAAGSSASPSITSSTTSSSSHNSLAITAAANAAAVNALLNVNHDINYQPLTPPSYADRSPSVASATTSHSPGYMPLSPASQVDSLDSYSYGRHSATPDLFSSPSNPELEFDVTSPGSSSFSQYGGPGNGHLASIDTSSDPFYSPYTNVYSDLTSPVGSKRSREFDELLTDTLGSFAMDAKKKRLDPSYNPEIMDHLNALSTLMELNPVTPDHLLSSLPGSNDWNQFNQFNQLLFEEVSGEVYEPLFPEFNTTTPKLVGTGVALDPFNLDPVTGNPGLFMGGTGSEHSIYDKILPVDINNNNNNLNQFNNGGYNVMTTGQQQQAPAARTMGGFRPMMGQTNNPFIPDRITLNVTTQSANSMRGVKSEPKDEKDSKLVLLQPTIEEKVKIKKEYKEMSTQTQRAQQQRQKEEEAAAAAAAAEGGMMIRTKVKSSNKKRSLLPVDVDLLDFPSVPNTELPVLESLSLQDQEEEEEEVEQNSNVTDGNLDSVPPAVTVAQDQTPVTRVSGAKARIEEARRRREAAAAAAAAGTATTGVSPVDAIEDQLRNISISQQKKPQQQQQQQQQQQRSEEDDIKRQMKAAVAREKCAQDPVRKQHAQVVLSLLRNMEKLMNEHRQRMLATGGNNTINSSASPPSSSSQPRTGSATTPTSSSAAATSGSSMYPRTRPPVPGPGAQIRTTSSYLSKRTPTSSSSTSSPSTAVSDESGLADYSQLRSSLNSGPSAVSVPSKSSASLSSSSLSSQQPQQAAVDDSSSLYPSSDLHRRPADEPLELSEEERVWMNLEPGAKVTTAL